MRRCALCPCPQNRLMRIYDFTFGFCIPCSTNTWEAIYDVPEYSPRQIREFVSEATWMVGVLLSLQTLKHQVWVPTGCLNSHARLNEALGAAW